MDLPFGISLTALGILGVIKVMKEATIYDEATYRVVDGGRAGALNQQPQEKIRQKFDEVEKEMGWWWPLPIKSKR